jgi:hypothetical protein
MRQVTFPLRQEADDFAESVDRQGWDIAFAALGQEDQGSVSGSMSLERLREIVLKSDYSD